MSDTYFTYSNQNLELKYRLRCFFLTKMLAQHNGHCIEQKVFCPGKGWGGTLIFSHICRLGLFLGVQNSEFQYFLGFSEK